MSARVPLEIRFWSFVSPEPNTGCWLWTGSVDELGYGMVQVASHRIARAHRVAWELTNGPIPPGMMVLHSCIGSTSCVNPSHLRVGTHKDNMEDRARQKRAATGDANGTRTRPETRPRGSRHPDAKLNETAVDEIKRRALAGEKKAALAREYGVDRRQVFRILAGSTWRHVK